MPLSTAANNAMLTTLASLITHFSIHTAYSSSGANEASGGSPAYARKPAGWGTASNSAVSSNVTPSFDVPSGTYGWIGFWSALTSGTFYGMAPNGSTGYKTFQASASANTIICEDHGLVDNDRVVFFGSDLPTGITEGTAYHVITAATDTFQISTSQGGSAVDITDEGTGILSKIVFQMFSDQGTLAISTVQINLTLAKSA